MALFTTSNLILLGIFTLVAGFSTLATALERPRIKKSFYIWMGLLFEVVMIEILLIVDFLQGLPSNYNYILSIIGGLQVSFMVSSLFFPQLRRDWVQEKLVARLIRLPRTKLYVTSVLLLLFVWVPLGIPIVALILTIQGLPNTYRALLGYVVTLVFGILGLVGALKAPAERRRRLLFVPVILLLLVAIVTIYFVFNLYMHAQHGT